MATWGLRLKCTGFGNGGEGCGVMLRIQWKAFFFTESEAYPKRYAVECPKCHAWTDVDESKIPRKVKEGAPQRALY